jgi:outer membrane protein
MIRRLTTVLLLLLAAPVAAEDLLSVYARAREHDTTLAAARAHYQASIEKEPQGRSQLLPTLGLSASSLDTTDQRVKTPGSDKSYNYTTNGYSLSLTQPLYRKQNFAAYAQGKADAAKAEYDLVSAEHELMQRTTRVYLSVLAAQDVLDFARLEKIGIERLLTLVRRNFSVGATSLVDVHAAQARYDLAVADEIAAANGLEIRREALRVIIREAPPLARLNDTLELRGPEPADMVPWVEAARTDNPQVKAREQAVASAQEELEKNRAGHYPTLDLTASRSYADAGGSTLGIPTETTTNQVGLVFQLPLYQGGNVSSKVRESFARRDEASQKLDQSQREAAQQAREAYLAVSNGIARVKALVQAQASNQRALDTTVLGYERGARTGVDVLNTQRELFITRRDLSQARYDYLLSRLRLKAAVGTLSEADLADINRLLAINPTSGAVN